MTIDRDNESIQHGVSGYWVRRAKLEARTSAEDLEPESPPSGLIVDVPPWKVELRGVEHWFCPLCGITDSQPVYVPQFSTTSPWSCLRCYAISTRRTRTHIPGKYVPLPRR